MENNNSVLRSIVHKSLVLSLVLITMLSVGVVISLSGVGKYFPAGLISFGPGTVTPADPNHFAYAEDLGWIDFNPSGGNAAVTDSALTGYAWSENAGWISFNCSNANACAANGGYDYSVANDGYGNLSGYAYGENVGWINFDPTYNGTDYGVKIDDSGNFSGYAWGENTGWISFNCSNANACADNSGFDYKVSTTWKKTYVQVPTTITIQTQPAGRDCYQVPLTTQPSVLVKDQRGTNMTDGTVAASLTSGSGILAGTLTANISNGVATFTDISYNKVVAFTITFTSGSATAISSSIGPLSTSCGGGTSYTPKASGTTNIPVVPTTPVTPVTPVTPTIPATPGQTPATPPVVTTTPPVVTTTPPVVTQRHPLLLQRHPIHQQPQHLSVLVKNHILLII